MKVYVAGPMRGYREFNFPVFTAVARHLRIGLSYEVVSPHEHDLEIYPGIEDWEGFAAGDIEQCPAFDYQATMSWDLGQVAKCDAICMLPGWEHSSGARHERYVAEVCGKEVWLATRRHSGWCIAPDEIQVRVSAPRDRIFEKDSPCPKARPDDHRPHAIPTERITHADCAIAVGDAIATGAIPRHLANEHDTISGNESTDSPPMSSSAGSHSKVANARSATDRRQPIAHSPSTTTTQPDASDPCSVHNATRPSDSLATTPNEHTTSPDTSKRIVVNPTTGGAKETRRARFELLPPGPLFAIAEHFGRGAAKYEDRNWERGYEWSLSFGALLRHAFAWWGGEDIDEETGSSHLAACGFHVLALLHYIDAHPELDDRPEVT